MTDSYLYIILALLPLAAAMVVLQDDPYHALVIRGILGAIAAMSYAVLGAADVALTEALVGTMLAITLYAIAVRSSLVMRLGILEQDAETEACPAFAQLTDDLRKTLNKYHLRLELVPHANVQSLQRALKDRDVHGICQGRSPSALEAPDAACPYHITFRVHRLFEIFHNKLAPTVTSLSYVDIAQDASLSDKAEAKTVDLEEAHS
ncbi:DUF4040 domain-containing protein [Oscillatoria sp. FACHB-1407]|uniref:DUF4040 domain-containing protein n=1 Tax=Oscillatoria sp. FACHB-1407 TaxID=2692847 RepID=UPI001688DBD3|nr:DUF4040 domain-containing protein [Oscillatoria sp. FACHB-1407]MBD2464676.1 DUF4040 domain-containing protein [Oscillatoria sp. FACHB-1407]